MAYTVMPTVDVLTDVAYLLTENFAVIFDEDGLDFIFPLLCALSIAIPIFAFWAHLIKRNALCDSRIVALPTWLAA